MGSAPSPVIVSVDFQGNSVSDSRLFVRNVLKALCA